jgi:hypothetical protein
MRPSDLTLPTSVDVIPARDEARARHGARLARPVVAALAALVMVSVGCSKSMIPNTDVEDSSENRKVVSFCEEYRHGVEEKNVGLLLKLASPRYFEDGGNANAEDDIDVAGLKDYLTGTFMKTQTIRYEVRYRRISFAENDHVLVDYTYAASYRIPGVKQEEWRHTVAENRLELVKEGETFRILSGM